MTEKKQELTNIFGEELNPRPRNITNIEDLRTTPYPTGVNPPDLELSFPIEPGRFRYVHLLHLSLKLITYYAVINEINALDTFRYHRDFLLQFMNICTERPVSLVPLVSFGLDPREAGPGRPQGKRQGGALSAQQPTSFAAQQGPGLSRPGFSMDSQYPSSPPGDSRPRFESSNAAGPKDISFTGGGASKGPREAKRTRSQRGRDRGDKLRAGGFQTPVNQTANLEPVAPLELSKNRWIARSTLHTPQQIEERQLVDRKVRALLNKLTMDKFDSISDQILNWANRSEQEEDGATLKQVAGVILEQANEDTMFSEVLARLCRKMMERISSDVQDEAVRSPKGQPITGGLLFRKYLLNQCTDNFDRRWGSKKDNLATLSTAVLKSGEDKAAEIGSEGEPKEMDYFDEYYATAKAKRRSLGLVRFTGELFKLQMLTERIMHECIKKLLSSVIDPGEDEIESLCKLLTTVGQSLDNPKARNHMDIYFERMQEMAKGNNISFRVHFLLLDVIELRERHWQPRHAIPRPISLHQVSLRNDSGRRGITRGGSRRGEHRGNATEPDGWNVAGGSGVTRPPARAGDLSQFGKISKPTGIQFGPSSVFSKKEANKRDLSISLVGGANIFSTIGGGVPNRPLPVGSGPGGFPVTARTGERKKRNLLPKTTPDENELR